MEPCFCHPFGALALALALICGVQTPSLAQSTPDTTAFVVEQFEPLPSLGTNILNIGVSDVLPHLEPAFGIFAHYVDDPLVVRNINDEDTVLTRLVDDQLKVEFGLGIGLFDIASLSVVIPVTFAQSGDALTLAGRPGEKIDGISLNDIRVIPKFRILNAADYDGFGLSLAATVYIPVGDDTSFATDDTVRAQPVLGVDWRHESGFLVAGNVGYQIRPERPSHNIVSDDIITWGIGVDVPSGVEWISLVGSIYGAIQTADNRDPVGLQQDNEVSDFVRSEDPVEVLGGFRFRFLDQWSATIGVGTGLSGDVGSPRVRAFGAIGYTPTSDRDSDEDGVLDRDDACEDAPEDKDGFEDADGCPDLDNDKDGVPDTTDGADGGTGFGLCRDQPEDVDGYEDADGCPDPDNDGDGIPDTSDNCSTEPEDKDGFADGDGCPDPDNDADTIPDVSDGAVQTNGFGACMNKPEDIDGFADSDGCPDPDNDGDEILDGVDACPQKPETKNGIDDTDGCPDSKSKDVKIEGNKIVILKQVFFRSGKDTIKTVSYPILNDVSDVLLKNPWITGIRVDGHTDDDGSAKDNEILSDRRAAAIKQYFEARGIDGSRLASKGFGESIPIGDNKTKVGKAENRRVEFTILSINGAPVGDDPERVKQIDNKPTTLK